MMNESSRIRVGILGCGAIGSGIAKVVHKDLKKSGCLLSGIFDTDLNKCQVLQQKLRLNNIVQFSYQDLIRNSDLIVEAIVSPKTKEIIQQAIDAKKHVLSMSVGRIFKAKSLFQLAKNNGVRLLIPSGAIAGIDAVKAAHNAQIKSVTLTTRKPLKGFIGNEYLKSQGIILDKIKKEKVVFDGSIDEAVQFFPQNINVAGTLALACGDYRKVKIRIITSPEYTLNSHEIEVVGDFGRLTTKTENVVCPDNPKTSYLAILSGIQTLKEFCSGIHIGT